MDARCVQSDNVTEPYANGAVGEKAMCRGPALSCRANLGWSLPVSQGGRR